MSVRPHFEVFQSHGAAQEFRWRLVAANGEIVAQSEGYTRAEDAERACGDAAEAFRGAERKPKKKGDAIPLDIRRHA